MQILGRQMLCPIKKEHTDDQMWLYVGWAKTGELSALPYLISGCVNIDIKHFSQ